MAKKAAQPIDQSAAQVADILQISVANLRQRQYIAYKNLVISRLLAIVEAVDEDSDPNSLIPFACHSPAGDGYGSDNHFIDFGLGTAAPSEEWEHLDFFEMLEKLAELRTGTAHNYDWQTNSFKACPGNAD